MIHPSSLGQTMYTNTWMCHIAIPARPGNVAVHQYIHVSHRHSRSARLCMPIHACVTSPSPLSQARNANTWMCHIAIPVQPGYVPQYIHVSHRHPRSARLWMPIHACVTSPSPLSQAMYANTCMCHIAIPAQPGYECQYMHVSHRHPRSARLCMPKHACVTSPFPLSQAMYANTCMCHIAIPAQPGDVPQYMHVSHRHPRSARLCTPKHTWVTLPSLLSQAMYANTWMCHIAILAQPGYVPQYMHVSHRHPRSARRCTPIHAYVTSPSSLSQAMYAKTCMRHIAILAQPGYVRQNMHVSHRHRCSARLCTPIHGCVTSPSSLSQVMYPNTCMCHIDIPAQPGDVPQYMHMSHRHPRSARLCTPKHACVTSPSTLSQAMYTNTWMCHIAILAQPGGVRQYMDVSHRHPRSARRCTPIHACVTSTSPLSQAIHANTCICHIAILAQPGMYSNTCMCHIAIPAQPGYVCQYMHMSHRHPRSARHVRQYMHVLHRHPRSARRCSPKHACATSPSPLSQAMYANTCMCHIAILAGPDDVRQYMHVSHRHPRWARPCTPIHACVTLPSSPGQTMYANTYMHYIAIPAQPGDVPQYMHMSHRHPRSARLCTPKHACVTLPFSLSQAMYAKTCMCHIAIAAQPGYVRQYMDVSHRHPRSARLCTPIHACVTSTSPLSQAMYPNTCICHIAILAQPGYVRQNMHVSHRHPGSARRCTPIHGCVTSPSSLSQAVYANTWMCHIAILAQPGDVHQYMHVSHQHPRSARLYMPIHAYVTSPSSLSQACTPIHECVTSPFPLSQAMFANTCICHIAILAQPGMYANTCMCYIAILAQPGDVRQNMHVPHRHPRSARLCTPIHACVTSPSSPGQTMYANTCMCHIAIPAEPDHVRRYMHVSHCHPRRARRCTPIHTCITSPSPLSQEMYTNTCICHIAIRAQPGDVCQYMHMSQCHPRLARLRTPIHKCVTSPSPLSQEMYANTCMCHIAIFGQPGNIHQYMHVSHRHPRSARWCTPIRQYMYMSHRHPRSARRCMPIHVCVTSPSSLSQTMYPNTCMCHIAIHALLDVVQQCVHVSHHHPRWAGRCMPIHVCVTSPSSLCQTLCGNACMCPIAILAEPDDVCQYMYVSHCHPPWARRCTPILVCVTSPSWLCQTLCGNACMCPIAILAEPDDVPQYMHVSHRHPRWAGQCMPIHRGLHVSNRHLRSAMCCMPIHACVTSPSPLSHVLHANTCMCQNAIFAQPCAVCQYKHVSHRHPRSAMCCMPIHACVTSPSLLSQAMYINTCMCHIAILAQPGDVRQYMHVLHRHPRSARRCT